VKAAAEQIESYLRSSGRALEFRVDGNTGRTVVSVRNPQTGELIRQIPGEETLRLADMLGNGGSLIDVAV
jgi:flagellar protein FlaG